MRNYKLNLKNKIIKPSSLKAYAAVILVTDHDNFDYKLIKKYSNIIIDTRGKFKNSKNIYRA